MDRTEHTAYDLTMTAVDDPWLMLTPAGVLYAYAKRIPDEQTLALQALMPCGRALKRAEWLALASNHAALLSTALNEGWVHEVHRSLRAPDAKLDHHLPHVIAGLSAQRTVALGSGDGFCLARVGYSEDEAETLCAMAAEFADFVDRQHARGWSGIGRAASFFEGFDMLMPSTSLVLFWVDGVSYWLILGGEPLINNTALVELVWGLRAAGAKFSLGA